MPIWVLCDGKVLIFRRAMHVMTEHKAVYGSFYQTDKRHKGRIIISIQ